RHYADLQKFVIERGLGGRIIHLGLVSSADLLDLFRHAAAVVQPSLFEGWSTVVEDAKAVGRPIFLTDLAVHREQSMAPNPFYFFPPGDATALADLIAAQWPRLSPGPDPVAEMSAAMARRARARTSARAFLAIMREIAAAPRSQTAPITPRVGS
ncbi:MAG: glycosyltransferase, partial [Rhodospirillaceae bacterium]|nr:glycosyltransferase [Rhodospirillaceae bacterium]